MEEKRKWRDLSDAEVIRFKRKQCVHCYYFSKKGKGVDISNSTCNYSAITGKSRFCSPLECKEKGFYEELKGRRRPQIKHNISLRDIEHETKK